MLILRINTKKIKINLIGILIYKILNKNWLTVSYNNKLYKIKFISIYFTNIVNNICGNIHINMYIISYIKSLNKHFSILINFY